MYLTPDDPRVVAVDHLRDAFRQFERNGRWGTCGGCPRDAQHRAYPEFCEYTARYDHQLDVDALTFQFKHRLRDAEQAKARRADDAARKAGLL